jgi:hypothetical protein
VTEQHPTKGNTTNISKIDLVINNVEVNKDDLIIKSEGLSSSFNQLNATFNNNKLQLINTSGEASINSTESYLSTSDQLLAQFDKINIANIVISKNDFLTISFEKLNILNSQISKNISVNKLNPAMTGFSDFEINQLTLKEQSLSIDKLTLSGLYANILLDKGGALKNLVSISNNDATNTSANISDNTDNEKSHNTPANLSNKEDSSDDLKIAINEIQLVNTQTIQIVDESITPQYKREFYIDHFSLKNLNSNLPAQQSPFKFNARSDKYSKINFSGHVKPFTPLLNLKIKGSLTEISLPPASGYITDSLGFGFESGELDMQLDSDIVDAVISGSSLIQIRGVALANADNNQQNIIEEQTSMPLNVALGMLKDDNDNIELDIPLYGDIESPLFGFSSFIGLVTKKAIQTAASDYLIKTFIPYANIVILTMSATDYLMTLKFEDLPYKNGQVEISDEQSQFMNQFVALMKDKKDAQVKVCAISALSDLSAINFIATSNELILIESEKAEALKTLSISRMSAFKDYVIKQDIKSSRILLCSPKVNLTPNAQPTISISA